MNKLELSGKKSQFCIYFEGDVQFVDTRVTNPVSFAHVADLHLPPYPPEVWLPEYRHAINWWDMRFGHPHQILPGLLDDICSRGVDFVFFGGDTLDCYHSETARLVVKLCHERSLPAYFQIGNHDWEDERTRYVTHDFDRDMRNNRATRLMCQDWKMPAFYYSFELKGVRFISLDILYTKLRGNWEAFFDNKQTDWFITQLNYDGPIVVFHHVPFNRPTLEYRIRAVYHCLLCVLEDDNGRRILSAIENCPNILGTFTAHFHFRSEDPIGDSCQFTVPPGHNGEWRYVKIAGTPPPKSISVPGAPVVESGKNSERKELPGR